MVPLNSIYFTSEEGYVPLILHLGSGVTWGEQTWHFGSADANAIMAMDVSQGVLNSDIFNWFCRFNKILLVHQLCVRVEGLVLDLDIIGKKFESSSSLYSYKSTHRHAF